MKGIFQTLSAWILALSLSGCTFLPLEAEAGALQFMVKEGEYCEGIDNISTAKQTFKVPFGADGDFKGTYEAEPQLVTVEGQIFPRQTGQYRVELDFVLSREHQEQNIKTVVLLVPGKPIMLGGLIGDRAIDDRSCHESRVVEITLLKDDQ